MVPLLFQPAKEDPCPSQSPVKGLPAWPPQTSAAQAYKPNPVWFKPVMFGLMIIGLLWIITFYITEGAFPVRLGDPGTSSPASESPSSAS